MNLYETSFTESIYSFCRLDYSSFTWAFSRILRSCVYPFRYHLL